MRRIYVKPWGETQWSVQELTVWQAFVDDWREWGARVALHNLLVTWGLRKVEG